MTARAAHLVDEVIPHVPTRQWVLSLPFQLRFRLAFDHDLTRAVLLIFTREVFAFYRERARQHGWPDGHTGSVTVIQRFGGALNLNLHFHTLVLDGVFNEREDGALRFLPLPAPADRQVAEVLARVVAAVMRLLVRRGIWVDADGESAADGDPTLHDSR